MQVTVSPSSLFINLIKFLLLLLCLNVLGIVINNVYDNIYLKKIFSYVDFDTEANIPTVFSFLLLLTSAFILGIIAKKTTNTYQFYKWAGLSLIFLFLSLDEMVSIHESFIPLLKGFHFTGLLYYSWVIPYSIGLLIFLIIYIPFLLRLPRSIAFYLVLSGALFVSGAIGVELFEGRHAEMYGYDIYFSLFYTVEEFLEMIAIILFINTLLKFHLEFKGSNLLELRLGPSILEEVLEKEAPNKDNPKL